MQPPATEMPQKTQHEIGVEYYERYRRDICVDCPMTHPVLSFQALHVHNALYACSDIRVR